MKPCRICGEIKPLSEFIKDQRKKDGTRNDCKSCYNLKKRKTPVLPEPKDGFKHCAKCGLEKPLEEFNYRSYKGEKKPYSYCKECERKIDTDRYQHTCSECGKEYKSGSKANLTCKACHNNKIGKIGRENLIKKNKNQFGSNNHMYGISRLGENNPNYNPEKTDEERTQTRIIAGYKDWRNSVYERDSYTCQCCGDRTGGNLIAHHLDGYNWCKEKRLEVENGITLCKVCHHKFHMIHGFRDNTKEQYESFIYHANTEVSSQMAQG